MIRDQELSRLEAYAKSLGIKVSYRKLKKEYASVAEFYTDGSGIVVYTWPGLSKTRMIINLLHEAAHAVHWVHEGKKIDKELLAALKLPPEECTKEQRKLIYEDEHKATHFWDQIVKIVDIKINPSVILLRKKLDIFAYRYYYETGNFPTDKLMIQKKKEYKNED